jgi:hypothetical protein
MRKISRRAYLREIHQIVLLSAIRGEHQRKTVFGAHGGISPTLTDVHQVEFIQKGVEATESNLAMNLLWGDPSASIQRSSKSLRVVYSVSGFLISFSQISIWR